MATRLSQHVSATTSMTSPSVAVPRSAADHFRRDRVHRYDAHQYRKDIESRSCIQPTLPLQNCHIRQSHRLCFELVLLAIARIVWRTLIFRYCLIGCAK